MANLFGKYINKQDSVLIGLCSLYGINRKRSLFICQRLGIPPYVLIEVLTNKQILELDNFILKFFNVESNLKENIRLDFKKLLDNQFYRGLRHKLYLPVRGQRTHTNRQTQKKLAAFRLFI